MLTREIISKMKELISKGWCQGSYSSGDVNNRSFCLEGAFAQVCYFSCIGIDSSELNSYFRNKFDVLPCEWNDQHGRTQQEVLDELDLIAANLSD